MVMIAWSALIESLSPLDRIMQLLSTFYCHAMLLTSSVAILLRLRDPSLLHRMRLDDLLRIPSLVRSFSTILQLAA